MVRSVNNIPQRQDVFQQTKRGLGVALQVFQHGEVVVEADRLGVVNAQSSLCSNDSLPLQLDRRVDVQVEILVLVAFRLKLLNTQSNELMHGDGVLVVGCSNFRVDDLVDLLVHVDTLEHELQAERDIRSVQAVSTGFEDFLGDGCLAQEMSVDRLHEMDSTYRRRATLDDGQQRDDIRRLKGVDSSGVGGIVDLALLGLFVLRGISSL